MNYNIRKARLNGVYLIDVIVTRIAVFGEKHVEMSMQLTSAAVRHQIPRNTWIAVLRVDMVTKTEPALNKQAKQLLIHTQ